jgi:hypothetical protein
MPESLCRPIAADRPAAGAAPPGALGRFCGSVWPNAPTGSSDGGATVASGGSGATANSILEPLSSRRSTWRGRGRGVSVGVQARGLRPGREEQGAAGGGAACGRRRRRLEAPWARPTCSVLMSVPWPKPRSTEDLLRIMASSMS